MISQISKCGATSKNQLKHNNMYVYIYIYIFTKRVRHKCLAYTIIHSSILVSDLPFK